MALNEGFSYREEVRKEAAGRSLLEWLAHRYRHSSPEVWRERLEKGEILLDGRPPPGDPVLTLGQELVWNRPPWDEPDVPLHYELVFEDDALIAVAKPSGLPTMPAGGGFYQHTLLTLVRRSFPEASPLHRLGRGTSGLVLFAKDGRSRATLARAFRERRMRKVYRCIASGDPPWDRREIDVAIGEVAHPALGSVHAATTSGKPSMSIARVVERRGDSWLAEVEIETGRPHQIRIHLAAAGHPLVGDPLYRTGGVPAPDALPGDLGYSLHAWKLGLEHPVTGGAMELEAPLPAELRCRQER